MKKKYLLCFNVLLLCLLTTASFAQKTVTGTVKDAGGNALPGVSVLEKGTKNGTSTGVDGKYTLNVKEGARLIFRSIGMITQELLAISGQTIVMSDDSKVLNEVIVTGFGVKKEVKRLSYSATAVSGSELTQANNANVENALQGKVAGVMINQGASGPTSSSRIRIRGNTSLSTNTQPLIVYDGILIEPGTSGADSWGDATDFGNIMKNINADDIESISVLKGAAASALYGSKAAGGVLLITSKKGKTTKGLGVSVSQTTSFDVAYKFLDLQNEYGGGISPVFAKDANGVDVVDQSAGYYVGGYSFGPKLDGRIVKDLDGVMRPWVANNPLDFFDTGKFINTNISFEGANDNTTYRLAYTNLNNSSVSPGNSLNRNAFALRVTRKISKSISVDASVNYTLSNSLNPARQGGNSNPLFAFTYYKPRNVDLETYLNNNINPVTGGALNSSNRNLYDPYAIGTFAYSFENDNRTQKENNLLANIDVNINILPWLSALIRTNTNFYNIAYERKNRGNGIDFAGGDYEITQNTNKSYRVQGLLNATKQFANDFELNASLGGETYQKNLGNSAFYNKSVTSGGLKIADVYAISNSINPATTTAYPNLGERTDAVYLYGDLTWKNMLTLNLSGRNDWSSALTYRDGHGNYSYFYPSAGLAWIFTELPVFQNNRILSFGKLRASYSFTGLSALPQQTNTAGYYKLQDGTFSNAGGGNQSVYGFSDNILKNNNLRNELTKEFEIGTNLGFFKNRLSIDFAYYKKNSYNQILSFSLPQESGVSSQALNAGNIQNQGIEILVTGKPVVSKDFNWNASATFTRNRNKIIELAPGVPSYPLDLAFGNDITSVGQPGEIYGSLITGSAFSYYQKKDANGNPIASPSNGKKVLGNTGYGTTGGYYTFVRSQDYDGTRKNLGTMMESYLAGTQHNVSYKNFSLGFQIDAKIGGLIASGTHQYGSANGSFANSLFGRDEASGGVTYTDDKGIVHHDGIIPDGVLNDGIKAKGVDLGGMTYADAVKQGLLKPIPAYAYYENLSQWSSGIREYSVFENSWVALREVTVGYNVPNKYLTKLKINTLSLNLTGRNIAYLYKTVKDDINPESIYSNRAGAFAEYGGWPLVRSLGFNIRASF
ncbi:SusC/RagA family TonB-linked outer membrane protein [Pedobacter endophyticus]|uniref:SusC/RagA family TonB-linked outer membrane protein n=1 Tax=Pedobacter endophyticus TaxID=2789740 RepID=A0A7S9L2V9_9SPHI|nr:SusC/RagA family TonB-linked outer membrane protein [Pedobacter endophyticus]QPH41156.1 SusC/RagA family TonB-linked outer membrane protein [Pedobacter endophyticus]